MILVIDDDKAIQTSISLLLKQNGYTTRCTSNPKEAQEIIKGSKPELIILDMNFSNNSSGEEGLLYLSKLKAIVPKIPVILITAWASIPLAIEGIKKGAFDFISKPWENENLLNTIKTVFELTKEPQLKVDIKRKELDHKYDFSNIIGNSPEILSVLSTVGRVSKTDAPVLILGESGTGKELFAEAIHKNSNRHDAPFVKVNLGGISSSLFESEIFGHVKGAFTDAYNDRKGRFELADKGTIFLDEIGDLDLNSQVKLLRVLQDKTYQVLGESNTRKVNVRVVCATNRNLKNMMEKGTFREDLYYRINLITINIPSLRERESDIPLLIDYFIQSLKNIYNIDDLVVSPESLKWLKNITFTGNIRELKNLIERTWLILEKNKFEISDFEKTLQQTSIPVSNENIPPVGALTLEQIEKEMIIKTLKRFQGNMSKTAKSLGISRAALYRRIEKHGLSDYLKLK
jgi:DNA-binding NtrC family response regulator